MARTPKTCALEVFVAKTRKTSNQQLQPKIHPRALPVKVRSLKPTPALQSTDRVAVLERVRGWKRGLSRHPGHYWSPGIAR